MNSIIIVQIELTAL